MVTRASLLRNGPLPSLRPTVMTAMMLTWAIAQPLGLFGVGPVLEAFGRIRVLIAFAGVQTSAMTAAALLALRPRAGAWPPAPALASPR